MSILVFVMFAMFPWRAPLAQSGRCTGMDLTCLEEDRDSHVGYCQNVSYKRIMLAGRDADNMRNGWYMYSHRGGGLRPLDTPAWRTFANDLELLRDIEAPSNEVGSCLVISFRRCEVMTFEDVEICLAEQHLYRLSNECEVTLAKGPLSEDAPAQWYGISPEFEVAVPLKTLPTPTYPGAHSSGYDRYGGAAEVLRWLELADSSGVERVDICTLRSAYECYTEGEHAGDASACTAPLLTDADP